MLTLKQVAAILQVDKSQVTKLIRAGKLPAQKIGDSMELFVSEADLRAYQDRRLKPGRPRKEDKQ